MLNSHCKAVFLCRQLLKFWLSLLALAELTGGCPTLCYIIGVIQTLGQSSYTELVVLSF